MFVLLVPTDGESGFKNLMRTPKIKFRRIEMKNAEPFYVMICPKYNGVLPYNAISEVLGGLRNKIVFPKNVKVQANSPVQPFVSRKLKRRLIFNTALEVLRERGEICTEKTVCIVDPYAVYRNEIEKFTDVTKKIEIVTLFPEKYALTVRNLNSSGADLTVKEGDKADINSDIIISDKADCVPQEFEGVLFTNTGKFPLYCECITGEGIDLSEYTDFEFSMQFDTLDIAEAMYVLNFAGKLGEKRYTRIITHLPVQK